MESDKFLLWPTIIYTPFFTEKWVDQNANEKLFGLPFVFISLTWGFNQSKYVQ